MNKENITKAARIILGVNLVFAGVSHLTFARRAFKAQVPDWLPLKVDDTVIYSGVAEILLGSAVIFTPKRTEQAVGKVAASFFTAVFPGNISQYQHKRSAFGLNTGEKRFIRLLFQPVLVYWALKYQQFITTGPDRGLNTMDLTNKVIVITGASSGVGRSAALEFAKFNACLVLTARNEHALTDVADECRELGAEALVVVTDVTEVKAVINLANAARTWMGKVDVWINNAGILGAGDFDATPMEVHEQIIRTNLLGYMNGTHAILPIFKEQGYGTIINNISIGGFFPVPYGAGYSASKFGLRGFFEALKAELVPWKNINVCDLFPAFLDTPGIYHAANYTGKELKPAPPVYDPKRVAKAMVKVAANPKANTYVGGASLLLKFSHALFPALTTRATGYVMRRYFNHAKEIHSTSGNVFNTVDFGMSTHGGFGIPGEPKVARNYLVGVLVLGVVAGFVVVGNRK